jgi:uncharacterized membrane protein required for colicin V production
MGMIFVNIVDILIFLFILCSALIGMKRGFTKELICFIGFFLIVILSFIFKNYLSILMYEHLPFFKFSGLFKGITTLNILIYEVIAFFITLSLLLIIFRIIKLISSVFEKLLSLTIILGIPSKILGFIIGIIDGITWTFIILYIVSLPIFNIKEIENSKLKKVILEQTPILSNMVKDTISSTNEFIELKDEYIKDKNITNTEFDRKAIDIFLKNKIISKESVEKLVEKDKLKIDNIEEILEKYEEE